MKGSAGYLKADALIESSITLMAAAEVHTTASINSILHVTHRSLATCCILPAYLRRELLVTRETYQMH